MGEFRLVRNFGGGITKTTEKAYRVETTALLSEKEGFKLMKMLGSDYVGRKYEESDEVIPPSFVLEISKIVNQQNKTMEDFILRYFGNLADLKEFGSDYILESYPTEVETMEEDDICEPRISIRMHQTYRLRPKTQEELNGEV